MSSIQRYITELTDLTTELKRLNTQSSQLRKQIKLVQKNILEYLSEKQQPGVKYRDMAVIVQNKTKFERKKKKEIEEDTIRLLNEYGIADANGFLSRIKDVRKGPEVQEDTIKIQRMKK